MYTFKEYLDGADFYRHYLRNLNLLNNPYCTTKISLQQYVSNQFVIVEDFYEVMEASGHLTCFLKFKNPIPDGKPHVVTIMPIEERKLRWDTNREFVLE